MQTKSGEKPSRLAGWFRGESEPITIGILPSPTKEKADPLSNEGTSSEIQPTNLLQRMSTASTFSKPAMASRFSFFSTKSTPTKPATQAMDLNDEWIDMNISTALLPAGSPNLFSPAAYKNLQQQAESLLLRLQVAYKERTMLLREMAAEKEALAEEAEGSETRARYAKTQLNDLSAKLAEQDKAMMNLVDELAQEKLARREEEEARKRSVRLVEHAAAPSTRTRRASLSNTVSDSGFESEDDSSVESLFSRPTEPYSPAMSLSSVSTTDSPNASYSSDSQLPTSVPSPIRQQPLSSTVAKGPSALYRNNVAKEPTQTVCANCNGLQVSEAWHVVSLLQEENKCIKQRIGELEGALDGCLDLVGGLS